MTKIVSASEFKAKCLQLIEAMQKDGEPVTITKRGRVVAELKPKGAAERSPLESAFGSLRSDLYRFDDPAGPVVDPDEWDANNSAELYRAR